MGNWVYVEHDACSPCRKCRNYGFFNFLWDCIMVVFTSGFWIIWIIVREMRRR